ncbi:hypothetical protein B0H14DRAFT_1630330, partial [Mycena olivaceomarginata]
RASFSSTKAHWPSLIIIQAICLRVVASDSKPRRLSGTTRYQILYYGGNIPASLPLLARLQFVAMKYRTVTLSD